MTPHQFLSQLERQGPAPLYLFLGAEAYQKELCKKALIERALREGERETGFVRHDLEEISLQEAIDDARSLSLFASRRLIWVSSAEAACKEDPPAALADYAANPSPDVVLVFEASRYDLEGEDKVKAERVRKFYSAVPAHVELARYSLPAAHKLAQDLAIGAGLRLDHDQIDLLVEAAGADAARLAVEIEKLRLYAGAGGPVDAETIGRLVPNARATTIFALVAALGRGDRTLALDLLDTLVREGEYLPLALNFLATQFRQALVAKEAGLRTPQQVQAHFSRLGTPMWPSKAQQVCQTVTAFSAEELRTALRKVYSADKALRDARPDDRVVMEEFVLGITR